MIAKENEIKYIPKVYLVQGLKHNMLSVGQLSQNGYEVICKGPTYTNLDKPSSQAIIARIQMIKNRMLPLVTKT